jgi:hypothetical protein
MLTTILAARHGLPALETQGPLRETLHSSQMLSIPSQLDHRNADVSPPKPHTAYQMLGLIERSAAW